MFTVRAETERPGDDPGLSASLFLLLALRMGLVGVLVSGLRMLLRSIGVLLTFGVVALTVMFGGGTMCLGSVFVVFGSLVVLVFSHGILVGC
jgi:hypothetical protein